MGKLRRGDDRRVGDVHAVVDLVLFLEAAKNGDRVFHRGLVHEHLLEAPLEGRILLDVLAVFVERRGAHAVQLAARERGLEHVAGVHGTFGLAGDRKSTRLNSSHANISYAVFCLKKKKKKKNKNMK